MNAFAFYRNKANLTQESVATSLDVDRSTVAKWEAGDAFPRANKLVKLAELYRCTLDDLLKDAKAV